MDNYVILSSLKTETTFKLINGIPCLRLLISSSPGSALRMHVKSLIKLRDSKSVLEALPGKLDIKRHSPSILYNIIEPRHEISNSVVCDTSKGSDQPAHMHSLIRAFAIPLSIL